MRTESDFIGKVQIPDEALYGIHSVRARENFPNDKKFPIEWYKAMGEVKLACYLTYKDFKQAVKKNYGLQKIKIKFLSDNIIEHLIKAANEVKEGHYYEHFIVPAIQGGAGTSINLNINEIITNLALINMGHHPGDYHIIDPIEAANIYQSTNDTVPTALKLALMRLFSELENTINQLRFSIENLERKYRDILRIGYTQMQSAVPSSYGRLFSSYNEALGRDWWRVSKCFERIKNVNLGGSAIGTSITVPRYFVMNVVKKLAEQTKLPITRAENLSDATSNWDALVEVFAIIKAHAVNLEKMASDIRLLASDLYGRKDLNIPKRQVGSSIMPAKVNPVIVEYVVSVAHQIYANDLLISSLSGQGNLELNAYVPSLGIAAIESLKLLISADKTFKKNLIDGLQITKDNSEKKLYHNPAITTALVPFIGYHKATKLAKIMQEKKINIFEANKILSILQQEKLQKILTPSNLLKNGFSINDLLDM